ncbi:MAG: hypothetical protein HQ564_08290 [Candidatus Saganbacteria bacterium]|nr:hypothetical protein [Candidatus Saganbacteria bacterium]
MDASVSLVKARYFPIRKKKTDTKPRPIKKQAEYKKPSISFTGSTSAAEFSPELLDKSVLNLEIVNAQKELTQIRKGLTALNSEEKIFNLADSQIIEEASNLISKAQNQCQAGQLQDGVLNLIRAKRQLKDVSVRFGIRGTYSAIKNFTKTAYNNPKLAALQREIFINDPRSRKVWLKLKEIGKRALTLNSDEIQKYQTLYSEFGRRIAFLRLKVLYEKAPLFRYHVQENKDLFSAYEYTKAVSLRVGVVQDSRLNDSFAKLERLNYVVTLIGQKGRFEYLGESSSLKADYDHLVAMGVGEKPSHNFEKVRKSFIERSAYLEKIDSLISYTSGAVTQHKKIDSLFAFIRNPRARADLRLKLKNLTVSLQILRSCALVGALPDVANLDSIKTDPALQKIVADIFTFNKLADPVAKAAVFGVGVGLVALSGGVAAAAGGVAAGIFGKGLIGTLIAFGANVTTFTVASRFLHEAVYKEKSETPFLVDLAVNTAMLGGLSVVGKGLQFGMAASRYGKTAQALQLQGRLSKEELRLLKEYKIVQFTASGALEVGYLTGFSQAMGSEAKLSDEALHNLGFILGLRAAHKAIPSASIQKATKRAAKKIKQKAGKHLINWAHTPTEFWMPGKKGTVTAYSAETVVAKYITSAVFKTLIRGTKFVIRKASRTIKVENEPIKIEKEGEEFILYKGEEGKLNIAAQTKHGGPGQFIRVSLQDGQKYGFIVNGKAFSAKRVGDTIQLNRYYPKVQVEGTGITGEIEYKGKRYSANFVKRVAEAVGENELKSIKPEKYKDVPCEVQRALGLKGLVALDKIYYQGRGNNFSIDARKPSNSEGARLLKRINVFRALKSLGVITDSTSAARSRELLAKYKEITNRFRDLFGDKVLSSLIQNFDSYLRNGEARTLTEAEKMTIESYGPNAKGFSGSNDLSISNKKVNSFLIALTGRSLFRRLAINGVEKVDKYRLIGVSGQMAKKFESAGIKGKFENSRYIIESKEGAIKAELMLEGKTDVRELSHCHRELGYFAVGLRTITMYNSEGVSPNKYAFIRKLSLSRQKKTVLLMLGDISHEIGHRYVRFAKEIDGVDIIENYQRAIAQEVQTKPHSSDYVRRHETEYRSGKKLVMEEDLCEAIRIYVTNSKYLRENFPQRFEFIKEKLPFIKADSAVEAVKDSAAGEKSGAIRNWANSKTKKRPPGVGMFVGQAGPALELAARGAKVAARKAFEWIDRVDGHYSIRGQEYKFKLGANGEATIFKKEGATFKRDGDLKPGEVRQIITEKGEVYELSNENSRVNLKRNDKSVSQSADFLSSNKEAVLTNKFFADADLVTSKDGRVYLEKQVYVDPRDGLINISNLSANTQGFSNPNLTIRINTSTGRMEIIKMSSELYPQAKNLGEVVVNYNSKRGDVSEFTNVDKYGRSKKTWYQTSEPTKATVRETVEYNREFLSQNANALKIEVRVEAKTGLFCGKDGAGSDAFVTLVRNAAGKLEITGMSKNLLKHWPTIQASLR